MSSQGTIYSDCQAAKIKPTVFGVKMANVKRNQTEDSWVQPFIHCSADIGFFGENPADVFVRTQPDPNYFDSKSSNTYRIRQFSSEKIRSTLLALDEQNHLYDFFNSHQLNCLLFGLLISDSNIINEPLDATILTLLDSITPDTVDYTSKSATNQTDWDVGSFYIKHRTEHFFEIDLSEKMVIDNSSNGISDHLDFVFTGNRVKLKVTPTPAGNQFTLSHFQSSSPSINQSESKEEESAIKVRNVQEGWPLRQTSPNGKHIGKIKQIRDYHDFYTPPDNEFWISIPEILNDIKHHIIENKKISIYDHMLLHRLLLTLIHS